MPTLSIKTYPKPYYEGTKSLDGIPYKFRVRWNTRTQKYYLDLTSLVDSAVTIRGMALLPGRNLLARYGYGHLLGALWVVDTSGANENPTYAGMGDRWQLQYTTRSG